MSVPFDLLDVMWGDEILRARPIGWNTDLTGDDINPEEAEDVIITRYELVCPNCGGRCEFGIEDETIQCECGSDTENPSYQEIVIDAPLDDGEIQDLIDVEVDAPDHGEPNHEQCCGCGDILNNDNRGRDELFCKECVPDKDSENKNSPESIFDSLNASISNTEIDLEEPDEEEKEEVTKIKKSTKKKIAKKKKKTTKKKKSK